MACDSGCRALERGSAYADPIDAGAGTWELVHRMGHSSVRAAPVYQPATSERDRDIAAGADKRIAKSRGEMVASRPRSVEMGSDLGRSENERPAGIEPA